MWIFTNTAFVSAVEHRDDPRVLVVRARLKGDLTDFFGPRVIVTETPKADYRFRTYVSRKMMKKATLRAVAKINYPNFKSSVKDTPRHDAYMGVWSAMFAAQRKALQPAVTRGRKWLDDLLERNDSLWAHQQTSGIYADDDQTDYLETKGFNLSRPTYIRARSLEDDK